MRNRFGIALMGLVLLTRGMTFGQAADGPKAAVAAPAAATPTFDVASVRPSEQLDQAKIMAAMQAGKMPRFGAHVDGLRAEYTQMPLKELVANAYDVKVYQVSGPDFLNAQRFDIVAKMPEGSTKADAPKMLRALLEERFKLEAQKKTEEHPVYALVVGKGGPKLKESAEKPVAIDPEAPLKPGEMKIDGPQGLMIVKQNGDGSSTANMGEQGRYVQRFDVQARSLHLEGSAISMQGLVEMLTQLMMIGGGNSSTGRQVLNMTELKGYYDVTLDISLAELMRGSGAPGGAAGAAGGEASDPGGGMGVFESVQKMGLKLEPRKAPVEQVVVSHMEKSPTEN
jgi:uncharacterized protein (TIGR03435 family)